MKLIQSIPANGAQVSFIKVPLPLVSIFKTRLLVKEGEVDFRITPEFKAAETMRVDLRVFGVVGVNVYEDGDDIVVHCYQEINDQT